MAGAGKKSDQQRARVGVLFFQQPLDRLIGGRSGLEDRKARRVNNAEWFDYVEVSIDGVRLLCFSRGTWVEVREASSERPGRRA